MAAQLNYNNRDEVFRAVTENRTGSVLRHAAHELKNDKTFILSVVRKNAFALRYASDALQMDREVVQAAVQNNGFALAYASRELQGDRELVLAAVEECGRALASASIELQGDREVVLAAVQNDGTALKYASEPMQDDYDVVSKAVESDGTALQFASPRSKNNTNLVIPAMTNIEMDLRGGSSNDFIVKRKTLDIIEIFRNSCAPPPNNQPDKSVLLTMVRLLANKLEWHFYEKYWRLKYKNELVVDIPDHMWSDILKELFQASWQVRASVITSCLKKIHEQQKNLIGRTKSKKSSTSCDHYLNTRFKSCIDDMLRVNPKKLDDLEEEQMELYESIIKNHLECIPDDQFFETRAEIMLLELKQIQREASYPF